MSKDNPSPSDITGARQAELGLTSLPFLTNSGFALVALGFLLPFFEIRCNGTTVAVVSGGDLLTGDEPAITVPGAAPGSHLDLVAHAALLLDKEITGGQGAERVRRALEERGVVDAPDAGGAADQDLVQPNPWAITLMATAVFGLLAHLLFRPRSALIASLLATLGSVAAVSLILGLRARMSGLVPADLGLPDDARITSGTGPGFWAACAGCALALITALMRMRASAPEKTADKAAA